MTPFTLVMAYYENGGMLREHLRLWRTLPPDIAANLHVRVIDDGSPEDAAARWCEGIRTHEWTGDGLASFQCWRMREDVRWNQDACRNVGVREAPTKWVLLTDMDHVVPPETWRRLMAIKLKKPRVYRFGRVTAPAMLSYKPHPNSWALTRDVYWQIGGYDEALAGNYGTDGDFLVRAKRAAALEDLPDFLIRYPREYIADASTTTLERKRQVDKENVNRIIRARNEENRPPLHFSFACDRVL